MGYANGPIHDLEQVGLRKHTFRCRRIHVAMNSKNRCNLLKLVYDVELDEVACVNNVIDIFESPENGAW